MTKSIMFGVSVDVTDNSLEADDLSITVFGTKGKEQSFAFYDADISKLTEFFEAFNCVSLLFSTASSPGIFNIDAIKHPDRLRRIGLDFLQPTQIVYSGRRNPFENLKELSISGQSPTGFPDLRDIPSLRKLELIYDKGFANEWLDLKQIDDLHVIDYEEDDLSPLSGLASLRRLRIESGTMKTLAGLERLPQLETLFISNTRRLTDVDAILNSRSLRNIMMESYQKVQDWDFLKKKDLRCIHLGTARSIDFIQEMPALENFYCRKVRDRNNKSYLFSTSRHQDIMTRSGIRVTQIAAFDEFYNPLDSLKS